MKKSLFLLPALIMLSCINKYHDDQKVNEYVKNYKS